MKTNFYQTTVITPANEFSITRFPRVIMVEYTKNGKLILPQKRLFFNKGNGDEIISDKEFQFFCGNLANLVLGKDCKNGKAV